MNVSVFVGRCKQGAKIVPFSGGLRIVWVVGHVRMRCRENWHPLQENGEPVL